MGTIPDWIIAFATVINTTILIIVIKRDNSIIEKYKTLTKALIIAVLAGAKGINAHSFDDFKNHFNGKSVEDILKI